SVIRMAAGGVPGNGSPDPSSIATIYWDKKKAEVFILVNNLPKAPSDKQYQLWAIVDNKPVSAGVFDVNENSEYLLKMTNISGPAVAFAVTLEKRGGSETPQGAMYVLGAI
ncbi:MAG: anti-sigma factor, partial [Chitinophagaceae bacterium]